jgi:hypothetical protein
MRSPLRPFSRSHTFRVLSPSTTPVGTGNAQIRCNIVPNRRRVSNFLPVTASSTVACFTRHPVLTRRCCRLVSDQASILFGSTRRRHRLPKL